MVIYYFENPRSLNNYVKPNLPVLYNCNNKSWMIAHLLQHGLLDILNPLLKSSAQEKKFLSIITVHWQCTWALEHDGDVEADCVVFIPADKTSILKPMDQGVISTFKSYDLRNIFCKAIAIIESESSVGSRQSKQKPSGKDSPF